MEKLKTYWYSNQLNINVQIVGLAFFIFYAFLALIFYKERTLSFDSAAFSFQLIQTKTFFTPLHRWGSVFSQIIPLLAIKSGCSLDTFLKTYSLGFVLYYYIGFLIITLLFKNNRIAFIYLLTLCLTYRNTFYFSVSELSQGLVLVIVLYAMLTELQNEHSKNKRILFFCSFVLISILYFFHQLLIIPITFVFIYLMIKNKKYKNLQIWVLFGFTICWFGFRLMMLPENSYELVKIPDKQLFIKQIPNFFNLPSFKYLCQFFKTEILLVSIFFGVVQVLILIKKKWLMFLLFFTYVFTYIVLITITYYRGESPNMYEQYYILFGFFIAFSLDSITQHILPPKIMIVILPLLIYGFYKIYDAHELPTKRLNYLTALVRQGQKIENKKYIIHADDFPWGYAWNGWELSVETLLLSSIESNQNSVTFYVPEEGEKVELNLKRGNLHAPTWQKGIMNTNILDADYFYIPEKTNYMYLNQRTRNRAYYYERIKYDYIWMQAINRKAKERGVSIDEMIKIDAQYMANKYEQEHPAIPFSEKEIIIQEIRTNKKWMNLLQTKAKERGISIDEMISIDAEYIEKNENQD